MLEIQIEAKTAGLPRPTSSGGRRSEILLYGKGSHGYPGSYGGMERSPGEVLRNLQDVAVPVKLLGGATMFALHSHAPSC